MKAFSKALACLLFIIWIFPWSITPEKINVWAIGDCHKINPVNARDFNPFVDKNIQRKNYLWDSSSNTITLFGAKNEYISFQIIIEAKNNDLKDVTVKCADLVGPSTISARNIKLFKEHYTHVWKKSDWPQPSTGTGEYPDALIPFETPKFGAPFSILKGRNQAVWVDVFIPKDTLPGRYEGNFSVSTGGKIFKETKVILEVWDFTLPDENHLMCWSNYYLIRHAFKTEPNDSRYIAIEQGIWKLCHQHRLNALLRHCHIRPEEKFDRQTRSLYFDFQSYADRLGAYLTGNLFDDKMSPDIFLLPISGGTEYRWPRKGPLDDPDSAFIYACKEFAAYYREMGWDLDKSYIYLSDEPKPEDVDKIIYDAKLIHSANKGLNTMVALSKAFNAQTLEKLSGSVDMWLVDASHYDSKLLLPRKKLGEKIGFYQQGEPWCGNENLDSDGLGFVTWPWIAWKYDIDCIYLYSMTEWGGLEEGHTVWDYPRNKSWSNSQGILLYPGNRIGIDEVVGSIRLKQIRRGMQDYEYMYLAKQKGKNPEKIVDSIIIRALDQTKKSGGASGEWSHNPADWFLARQNLANLILGEKPVVMPNVAIPKAATTKKQASKNSTIRSGLKNLLLRFANNL